MKRFLNAMGVAMSVFLLASGCSAMASAAAHPTAEEALTFLQSLPPLGQGGGGKAPFVQEWKDRTAEDIRTMKVLQIGGRTEDPKRPRGPMLRVRADDWKYFTAFTSAVEASVYPMYSDNACMVHLGRLTSLTKLYIEQSRVSDEGMKHLRGLINLTFLEMCIVNITDDAFSSIAELPNLVDVRLRSDRITGAGVKCLAKLRHLKILSLFGCSSIKDEALDQFAALGVEDLDLTQLPGEEGPRGGCTVTFLGLKRLLSNAKSLPNLKTLCVTGVGLSDEDIRVLDAVRPSLKIIH